MKVGRIGRSGVEGRCIVEGLVEGPLPSEPDFVQFLRTWERERRDEGFEFRVTVDGGRFDVHAHELEVPAPEVGRDPIDALTAGLEELVDALPEASRSSMHSTLRAVVYGKGTARRTLFAIRAPGVLEVVEDRALAETVEPPKPDLSQQARKVAFWVTLLLATLVFLVWGPGFSPLGWKDVSTVDPTAVVIESAPGGIVLERLEREPGARGAWSAVLRRDAAATTPASGDADAWLAWLGDARGRANLEWRDANGALLRVDPIDTAALEIGRELTLAIPVPPEGAARLRFGW